MPTTYDDTVRDIVAQFSPVPEEIPRMNPPDGPDDDTRETVKRLIDLIQVLAPTRRENVARAIEQCVLALVVDEMRQRIVERLKRFSPEDLALVDTMTAQMATHPRHPDDPPEEPK
jgi:hypothetical protein